MLKIRKHAYKAVISDDPDMRPLTREEKIVTYADKRVAHNKIVSLEERFEELPSLLRCRRFEVKGDVRFGKNLELIGDIRIINDGEQKTLEKKTLEGEIRL